MALSAVLLKRMDLEKQPLREEFWHVDTLASRTVNLSAHQNPLREVPSLTSSLNHGH